MLMNVQATMEAVLKDAATQSAVIDAIAIAVSLLVAIMQHAVVCLYYLTQSKLIHADLQFCFLPSKKILMSVSAIKEDVHRYVITQLEASFALATQAST